MTAARLKCTRVSEMLQKFLDDSKDVRVYALWALAFVGVCLLVGLEKVKPETLEYVLFALFGFASSSRAKDSSNATGS